MGIAAIHSAEFYREVASSGLVWSIKDVGGFPAPLAENGKRVMPFWSSEARALLVVKNVPAYKGFDPVSIDWEVFRDRWIPGLIRDGLLAGINWSGKLASGFDIEVQDLQRNVEALRNGT